MDVGTVNKHSFKNRDTILQHEFCSCYFCMTVSKVEDIEEWVDGGLTPLCPFCDIDAVLPGTLDKLFLEACFERWFSGLADSNGV